MKVSEYIFDFLKSKGIDTVFCVSGGAAAYLFESVRTSGITYVCNYHEQACAMAADGYARIANKPACVLVTNGPGSSNTITGVLGAYQDSIPMIIISGQVPTHQTISNAGGVSLRQHGVQECDIISMVQSITKYAVQVQNADDVQYHLESAYHAATTGRFGPVWIDVPLNIQNAEMKIKDSLVFENEDYDYDIDTIIELLLHAERPLIVTGNGIHLSKTENIFLQLKDKLQIPIVSTWSSKDLLSHNDELYVGNFGIFGERSGNFAIQHADLILILGSRMSIPNTGYQSKLFSPKSKKIMIDIDPNELYKSSLKIDYPIVGDLKTFLPKFLESILNVTFPDKTKWLEKTQSWKKKYPIFLPEYKENKNKINSFYFMEVLSKILSDKHVVVTDMGTSFTCTMQSLQMNGKCRLFTSSACCSMGFGLPGAIGAYFANNNNDIILIAGDGGFQMNLQELQTIIHYNIPIKIFILNNEGYLAISLMQDNLFNGNRIGCDSQCGVSCPNFSKVANAYGLKTYVLNNNSELENNIKSILYHDGPVLSEIMMVKDQLLIPRVQSSKSETGNIISGSLDNMFPFLPKSEIENILL